MKRIVKISFSFLLMLAIAQMSFAQGNGNKGNKGTKNQANNAKLEKIMTDLQTDLSLSDEQKREMTAVFKEYQPKLQKIRKQKANKPEAKKKKRKRINKLRKNREEKINLILTDEQYEKFKIIRKEERYGELHYRQSNDSENTETNGGK